MLRRQELQSKGPLQPDNPWRYGHGIGSSREALPGIGFRQADQGRQPEICFHEEAGTALLDLLCAAPVRLRLQSSAYLLEVDDVYEVRCSGLPAPRVYTYLLNDVVPFGKTQFQTYQRMRAEAGYPPRNAYSLVNDEQLLTYLQKHTERQVLRAYALHFATAAGTPTIAGQSLLPAGTLMKIDIPESISHAHFYGSNNNRFSAFSGFRLRTNFQLAHHWGLGVQRVHGAGRMIEVQP